MDGPGKAGSENPGNRFDFENLLEDNRAAVERFVRFRLPSRADAEDVLQEVYLTAYERFGDLKNQEAFLAWIISIARNKCSDYFREMARRLEMPFAALPENVGGLSACSDEPPGQNLTDGGVGLQERDLISSRHGLVMPGRFEDPGDTSEADAVRETLELLRDKDRQILYLYFGRNCRRPRSPGSWAFRWERSRAVCLRRTRSLRNSIRPAAVHSEKATRPAAVWRGKSIHTAPAHEKERRI